MKEKPEDAELKARLETAKEKWAEQKAEWERKAKEQTVPKAEEK